MTNKKEKYLARRLLHNAAVDLGKDVSSSLKCILHRAMIDLSVVQVLPEQRHRPRSVVWGAIRVGRLDPDIPVQDRSGDDDRVLNSDVALVLDYCNGQLQ